jgi:hypothetical protein
VPNADKAKIFGSGTAVGENWTSSKYNHHPAPPPGPSVPVVENVSCASVPAKAAMLPAIRPSLIEIRGMGTPFRVTTPSDRLGAVEKVMDWASAGTKPVWLNVGGGPIAPKY